LRLNRFITISHMPRLKYVRIPETEEKAV